MRLLVLLLATAIPLSGCAKKPIQPPSQMGPLLSRVMTQNERIRTLQANVTLKVTQADQKTKVKGLLSAADGDRLRVDIYSPFGQPMAVIVTDGARFSVSDLMNGTVQGGDARRPVTLEGIALPFPVVVLANVPRGVIPSYEQLFGAEGDARPTSREYTAERALEFLDAGGVVVERVEFDPVHGFVSRVTYFSDAVERLRIEFEGYAQHGESGDDVLPQRIVITDAVLQGRIEVAVSDVEVNKLLPEGLFVVSEPK